MERSIPRLPMNDGATVPQLGLGVMFIPDDELPQVITTAARLGYRHFDTATHYGNERQLGGALKGLDLDDELFVATKLPNAQHGYDSTLHAFERSKQALGRIDLYLLHWPQPTRRLYRDTWRAFVRLQEEGLVRSIGVCNFTAELMDELVQDTGVTPAVNQIELHPAFQQAAIRAGDLCRDVLTESWSPLGHGAALTDPVVGAIAKRLDSTPAMVILRWHIELGLIAIPKASSAAYLVENLTSLDLKLSEGDMRLLTSLDHPDGRIGPDPLTHTSDQGAILS